MKTAISIPEPVFQQAERLARERKVSRSELYTDAIRSYLAEHNTVDITARLNEVYGEANSSLDDGLAQIQFANLPKEEW
jgi:metal-responsive CopG/Arc/MetJ family transcriptional regulator